MMYIEIGKGVTIHIGVIPNIDFEIVGSNTI